MKRLGLWTAVLLMASTPAQAADIIPPASERFAAAGTEEVPSFQRHVVPLLGRLGCNGRACHGSFQGQGGFRLSLFGYDFQADHQALTGGDSPRADPKSPADSLMLLKPTHTVSHKGGKRMDVDSWPYRLLRRWIEAGAPGVKEGEPSFVALDVEPKEIVFGRAGEAVPLKVIAQWSDGSREDVTPLCRFRSNDEAIATVSESGRVTAVGRGDTDVAVFYDNGVVTIPVMLPVSDRTGPRYPPVPTPTRIDELVVAKLRKLGIVPSELCTDAEFLRRVSLDLTGTLPPPDEVAAFLADPSPDKRAKKVEELLSRPAYAAWWATKLCDFTGNSEAAGPLGGEQGLRREMARLWYNWLYRRVSENVPYDRIVEGIVLAVSRRPGQSYEDYCKEMSAYFRKEAPADFAARPTMPYYWTRRALGRPEERALAFAHSFLGVSLQCAQCHKHPYDQWTKQDFDQFTAFFNNIRYGAGNRDQIQAMKRDLGLAGLDEDSGQYKRKFVELLAEGKVLPFKELTVPQGGARKGSAARANPRLGRVITPKLLGGEEVIDADYADPRQPLMDWVRQEDNPYFARAFVNRVWASYFNVGLIDPPDDLNLANPPSNPALLDYLARGFIASGYDMKWLHRQITTSRTYQLSWRPNETNEHDERNYSRAVLRRLPAEVASDAVVLATASDDALKRLHADPAGTRAIGVASCFSPRDGSNYAVMLFGKPPRSINCDCERSNEPSLLQTVYLRNDQEILKLLDRKDGWLQQVARSRLRDPDELVRQAYLRTLSRPPDEREAAIARKHLADAGDTSAGLRDLLWALINTKEFIVNR
ncbi:MAG TPA: DUF1549 domain-containing protein [Gemmataceae bacterium]|nr:DUF1549 domain-containing protein [Gemmataceae bacterium]